MGFERVLPVLELDGEKEEEGFLGSISLEIPNSREISENQSLRYLMRKSVLIFSPFASA